jgi:hypothetical protein
MKAKSLPFIAFEHKRFVTPLPAPAPAAADAAPDVSAGVSDVPASRARLPHACCLLGLFLRGLFVRLIAMLRDLDPLRDIGAEFGQCGR